MVRDWQGRFCVFQSFFPLPAHTAPRPRQNLHQQTNVRIALFAANIPAPIYARLVRQPLSALTRGQSRNQSRNNNTIQNANRGDRWIRPNTAHRGNPPR